MLETYISQALYGISYGLLLFMLAAGLTLIFSMMGVLNFAHASFYMLGAYSAYQISTWIGFWPALVLAPLVLFLVGALVERYGPAPKAYLVVPLVGAFFIDFANALLITFFLNLWG